MMCQNVELPSAICHNTFQHVCRTLVSILAEYFRRTLLNILHKFGAEHFFFFFLFSISKAEGGSMGYDIINIDDIAPRKHF